MSFFKVTVVRKTSINFQHGRNFNPNLQCNSHSVINMNIIVHDSDWFIFSLKEKVCNLRLGLPSI